MGLGSPFSRLLADRDLVYHLTSHCLRIRLQLLPVMASAVGSLIGQLSLKSQGVVCVLPLSLHVLYVLLVCCRSMTEIQAPGAGPPRRVPSPLRDPPSAPPLDDSSSSEHASPPSPVSPDNEELWWLYESEPISPDGGPQNFQDLSVVQKFRTMIWVHKRRLLGRYKLFHKYLEYCPHRPSTALARSYAHSYARKLSRLRRTRRSILRPPLLVLGLSGFFNIRGQEGGMEDEAAGRGRGQRVDTGNGEGEGVGGGVQQPQVALMPDLAPAPGASSSSYLIEIFRLQPFAAAAYLRALLYCWFSGVFLQVQAALSFSRDQPEFIERAAWQWLLCQLVLQVLQAPARLKLYLRLLGVSHSGDAEEASNRIRLLVTSKLWMTSQALGTVFHTVAAFGPVFLWLVKSTSPVRRDVLSVCCANLLIFILRTALTFVIMHSILEARNARPKPLKRGLTKESIAKLRRMESNTEDDAASMCSICLCNFAQGDSMLLLPCDERHTFHDECITQWLVKNSSCPLCQRDVATE